MVEVDRRIKGQFQLRHILGMMTGTAVLFAMIAPQLRTLDPEDQFSLLVQAILLAAVVLAIMAILMRNRRRAELKAGPLVDRLEPNQSRWIFWLIASALTLMYVTSIVSQLRTASKTNGPVVLFGNPLLLFLAINFAVVRVWWHIDPRAIEVGEHGLILGGFRFVPWNDIRRYSWTGDPIRQLNLYSKDRHVTNFGIEAKLAKRLEPVLREHVL